MVASGSFDSLNYTIATSYGLSYLAVGVVKAYRSWREKSRFPARAPMPRGAKFFFAASAVLLAFPFVQHWMEQSISDIDIVRVNAKDLTIDSTPDVFDGPPAPHSPLHVVMDLVFDAAAVLLFSAPFFPWLLMLRSDKYKALHKHAKTGLCMAAAPPLLFALFLLIAIF